MNTTLIQHRTKPIAQAVYQVLSLFADEQRVGCGSADWEEQDCLVLSSYDDFDLLWGIGSHVDEGLLKQLGKTSRDPPLNIVLVNEGIPKSDEKIVNVASYLTPFDWVAALCCTLKGQADKTRQTKCPVNLFLIDPEQPGAERYFGADVLPLFAQRLPWLRIYRPGSSQTDRDKRLIDWLVDVRVEHSTGQDLTSDSNGKAIDRIRSLWTSELTRSETRHSVSNLVAPILLLGPRDKREDPHRLALKKLLDALKLLKELKEPTKSVPLIKRQELFLPDELDFFDRFQSVKFLLVDDQYELGYDQFVKERIVGDVPLETDKRVGLKFDTSPHCLVEALYRSFGLMPPEEASNEVQHLEQLISFCNQTRACKGIDDGVLDSTVAAVERILEESGSDCSIDKGEPGSAAKDWDKIRVLEVLHSEKPIDILLLDLRLFDHDGKQAGPVGNTPGLLHHLLLPLLLSHVDPSLPIVLFSSTQQRKIIQPLLKRPNIVCEFSKPTVSGYADTVDDGNVIDRFDDAVTKALRLHKIRVVWESLKELSDEVSNSEGQGFIVNESKKQSDVLVKGRIACLVDGNLCKQLAREYKRLLSTRCYADGLAVPSNVLESKGVKSIDSPFLFKLINVRLRESMGEDQSFEKVLKKFIDEYWKNDSSFACRYISWYLLGKRDAVSKTKARDSCRDGTLRKKFEEKEKEEKKREERDPPSPPRSLVKGIANAVFYVSLGSLRNTRAHYCVQPGRDDAELEDHVVWCWLWFINGLAARKNIGESLFEVDGFISRELLTSVVLRIEIPARPLSISANGLHACNKVVERIGVLLSTEELGISTQSRSLSQFALLRAKLSDAESVGIVSEWHTSHGVIKEIPSGKERIFFQEPNKEISFGELELNQQVSFTKSKDKPRSVAINVKLI